MKKQYIAWGAAAVLAAFIGGSGLYVAYPTGGAIRGTYIDGVDVSGKNRDELRRIISSLGASEQITLTDGNTKYETSLSELGISLNQESLIDDIMAYGYEGDIMTYLSHRLDALMHTKEYNLAYRFDKPKGESYLWDLSKKMNHEGQNASITIEGGQLVHHQAVVGRKLEVEATYKAIADALAQGEVSQIPLVINDKAQPTVTDADVAPINTILASYKTSFNSGNASRTHNITIASNKINGTYIKGNGTFSFNDVVGERTAEAGFDDAPVYMGGKLVPGIGGGICQVSSTLFNAALLSGMQITERDTHFAPVSYIPTGLDATVAWGYIDFQFKNPYKDAIYVVSEVVGDDLMVYILGSAGDKPQSVDVSVGESTTIPHEVAESTDPNSSETIVDEGHDGLSVTTTRRIIAHNGQELVDSFESYYEPLTTRIIKGTKAATVAEETKESSETEKES